jgi:hypothetical protein
MLNIIHALKIFVNRANFKTIGFLPVNNFFFACQNHFDTSNAMIPEIISGDSNIELALFSPDKDPEAAVAEWNAKVSPEQREAELVDIAVFHEFP